jgi:HlyD family secretion protein
MIGRLIRTLLLLLVIAAVAWGAKSPLVWVRALQPRAASGGPDLSTVETTRVLAGTFTLSVIATGKLRARTTYSVRTPAQMEGKLVWIAPDGTPIKKDDMVARLDDDDFKRQVRDIGLEYENARAEIEKSGRDRALEQRNSQGAVDKADEERRILIESNKVQLKQAQNELEYRNAELERLTTEYNRKKRQADEKLIPRTQVDDAEIAKNSAAFAADKAQKDLDLEIKKEESAVQQKETELENARFTVQTAQRRQNDDQESAKSRLANIKQRLDDAKMRRDWCTMRAPISGLLVLAKGFYWPDGLRVPRPGDQMWPNRPVAEIPDLSVMAVDCKIPERDIGSVHLDQPVTVRLDERPGQTFHGRVAAISSVASQVNEWEDSQFEEGTKVFTVTVEIKEHDPKRLIPGMNATLEIVTRQIPSATFVAKNCVFERGSDHVVYVKRGSAFQPVPVELGDENNTHVRILHGVSGGEWIATTDPTRILTNS